jgi:hypothetical protein
VSHYAAEHDAIVRTLQYYIEGSRAGKSELMRPGFHPDATIVGHFGGDLIFGPIQKLFDKGARRVPLSRATAPTK